MTLHDLHEKLGDAPHCRMRFVGLDGKLATTTFAELRDDVRALVDELAAAGLGDGDMVGIVGRNCYEWIVVDLALLALRCVSVAIPAEDRRNPVDVEDVTERYQLCAVLVVTPSAAQAPLPTSAATLADRPVRLAKRDVAPPEPPLPKDVFTIAFSSGTSGIPKGLLMSRAGIENTLAVSGAAWQVRPGDNILVVAPFSTFQQRYLTYLAIWHGFDVAVVAPERMFQKMRELEPTIIVGPPSFYEVVENRVRSAPPRMRWRYHLAAALHAVAPGRLTARARAWLGRPWAAMYGPRPRLLLTGSAPVGPRMVTVFQQLGIPLYEVYGSTEAGWVSLNLPGANRIGSAGRPIDGIEVELGDDDEIIVTARSPQAVGYRLEGEETAASTFLPDGRLATGDIGRFLPGGYLQLVGRTRNTLITRSGLKLNPEAIEREVEEHAAVDRAMVLLNDQQSALRCVAWLTDAGDPDQVADAEAHVASLSARRDPAQRIVDVVVRPASELTVETGLLTRNFKVDRDAVLRHLAADRARVGA